MKEVAFIQKSRFYRPSRIVSIKYFTVHLSDLYRYLYVDKTGFIYKYVRVILFWVYLFYMSSEDVKTNNRYNIALFTQALK